MTMPVTNTSIRGNLPVFMLVILDIHHPAKSLDNTYYSNAMSYAHDAHGFLCFGGELETLAGTGGCTSGNGGEEEYTGGVGEGDGGGGEGDAITTVYKHG